MAKLQMRGLAPSWEYDGLVARWIFLYGGLRYVQGLSGGLGRVPREAVAAEISGFRVVPHGSGLSYLLPSSPDASVAGTLWALDDDELPAVDELHGVRGGWPLYRRIDVEAATSPGPVQAFTYVGARIAEAP